MGNYRHLAITTAYVHVTTLFVGTWLSIFCLFFLVNRGVILNLAPSGDLAYDMILTESAKSLHLVTGHFSRYKFNHPGPFYFYVRAVFDIAFARALGSNYAAQFMGIAFVTTGFCALSGFTLAAIPYKKFTPNGYLAVANSLIILTAITKWQQSAMWMPETLIAPFAAFTALLIAFCLGRSWALVPAVFTGGVLIHGYLSMPLFVIGGAAAATIVAMSSAQARAGLAQIKNSSYVLAVVIVAIFLLPIVIDVVINTDSSNPAKVFKLLHSSDVGRSRGYQEIVSFLFLYWEGIPRYITLPGFIAAGIALCAKIERGQLLLSAFVILILMVLQVVYIASTPDTEIPLYICMFMFGANLMFLIFAIQIVAIKVFSGKKNIVMLVASLFVLIASRDTLLTRYHGDNDVVVAAARLKSDISKNNALASHEQFLALKFGDDIAINANEFVAGLLVELHRIGVASCSEAYGWAYAFSQAGICAEPEFPKRISRRVEVVRSADCKDNCIYLSKDWAGRFSTFKVPSRSVSFSNQDVARLFGDGWSAPEPWGTWTDGNTASLVLDFSDLSQAQVKLNFELRAYFWPDEGDKSVTVSVDGERYARWNIENRAASFQKSIELDLSKYSGPIVIRFAGLLSDVRQDKIKFGERKISLGFFSLTVVDK